MIEIKNLVKRYGDHVAVNDITFSIKSGEIVGFLGPNGAGKTTTMSILTGCLSSTSGSATINGIDIFDNPQEAKKQIGYLPEFPPLYLEMTVMEYLNRTRVEIGAELLQNRAMTIGEVMTAVGFSSEETFRENFRKFKGVAPREYRKTVVSE